MEKVPLGLMQRRLAVGKEADRPSRGMVGIYQHPANEDAYADGMSFLDVKPGKEDGWRESDTLERES